MSIKKKNIAIYGAGITAKKVFKNLKNKKINRIIAFVDDSIELYGKELLRIPIINFDNLSERLRKNKITEIYIAIPSLRDDEKTNLIKKIYKINKSVSIKITGGVDEILIENQSVTPLKEISYDNFLNKKKIYDIYPLKNKNIFKKNVLITGAGGSIGSELSKQVLNLKPKKLIIIDSSESLLFKIQQEILKNTNRKTTKIITYLISIKEKKYLTDIFKAHTIDTIYHAAAYKHVGLVENNMCYSILNNVLGTLNLCELTVAYKIKQFVLISSDKAVEPNNIMGLTKKISELLCQEFSEKKTQSNFTIVRFGNVIGSSGSVIPIFQKQILSGGPITLTHKKVERYFMSISEAVSLIIEAGTMNNEGKIFILDMGKPIKIFDLAKKMCNFFGYKLVGKNKKIKSKNDIMLKIIGLNKGEKIKEKLFLQNENFEKSSHPLILKSKKEKHIKIKIIKFCKDLIKICNNNDIKNLKKLLKKKPISYNKI